MIHNQSILVLGIVVLVVSLTSFTDNFVEALLASDAITDHKRAAFPSQISPSFSWSSNVSRTRTSLLASSDDNDKNTKKKKAQGVYVRPSGAIEKGSGFFVPGLEGPKVRLVIGVVLLTATAVNHFVLGNQGSFGSRPRDVDSDFGEILSFSEVTAIVYSVLLLFQSAIEYAKEALPESYGEAVNQRSKTSGSTKASSVLKDNTEVLEQKWSSSIDESNDNSSYRSGVQWAAASFVSMTPTTQMMLLAQNGDTDRGIQYRLGSQQERSVSTETIESGVAAALDELSKSKGGRIALPMTHPAVKLLGDVAGSEPANEEETSGGNKFRTVILQRITDELCWMVASDQLLAGYTKGDLKWLGKLAGYVAALE